MEIKEFFRQYPNVAVAFSGGVDSAYLLYEAKQCAEQVGAYYVKTPFQPRFEWEDAARLASELGVEMKTIVYDILAEEKIRSNPPDRCFFCKKRILSAIVSEMARDGFFTLLDGTNASDEETDRPGMRALGELSVLSPLRLCGLTKEEIRRRSKQAGLFTWDKPAYACLATRIPAGQPITEELLRRTERAENYLASLGFVDFRVRTVEDMAKLQVKQEQFPLVLENRERILKTLSEDYAGVYLDLEARDEQ